MNEFKKNDIPYEREVSLELFYEGKKYEITEPSLLFKTYATEKDKAPEIVIVPCASAIKRLIELKEMRNNYRKVRDCGDCEKVCCDTCHANETI